MFQTTNQTNVCTISRSVGIKGASLLADIEWHILGYSADRIGEETLEEPWDLLIVGSHNGGQRGLVAGQTVGALVHHETSQTPTCVVFCSYFSLSKLSNNRNWMRKIMKWLWQIMTFCFIDSSILAANHFPIPQILGSYLGITLAASSHKQFHRISDTWRNKSCHFEAAVAKISQDGMHDHTDRHEFQETTARETTCEHLWKHMKIYGGFHKWKNPEMVDL